MERHRLFYGVLVLLLAMRSGGNTLADGAEPAKSQEIRLIVRGDDIGSCHASNEACIQCYREGIVRSVEVMVPCPWFNEAVKMLGENPGLDVGVHLDLTSEWEFYKWGPLTRGPSLVYRDGYFFPMTSQRADFPPGTGFLQANPKIDEVEKELRAQIERAKTKIPNVSHLSSHMGTPTCTPELRALVNRLAQEYKLPLEAPAAKPAGGFGGKNKTPSEKEAALVKILEDLKPGLWLIIEHPGMDTPEMRAIGHNGYRDVAADRDGVTKAFTSRRVRDVVEKRGVKLISYADLYRE
jgi:hypothetical protein